MKYVRKTVAEMRIGQTVYCLRRIHTDYGTLQRGTPVVVTAPNCTPTHTRVSMGHCGELVQVNVLTHNLSPNELHCMKVIHQRKMVQHDGVLGTLYFCLHPILNAHHDAMWYLFFLRDGAQTVREGDVAEISDDHDGLLNAFQILVRSRCLPKDWYETVCQPLLG